MFAPIYLGLQLELGNGCGRAPVKVLAQSWQSNTKDPKKNLLIAGSKTQPFQHLRHLRSFKVRSFKEVCGLQGSSQVPSALTLQPPETARPLRQGPLRELHHGSEHRAAAADAQCDPHPSSGLFHPGAFQKRNREGAGVGNRKGHKPRELSESRKIGKHFTFVLIVVYWKIPTQLLKDRFLLPFQRQEKERPEATGIILVA